MRSTIVEIQIYLQTDELIELIELIYNSRNLDISLDYQDCKVWHPIYNSRNLDISLDKGICSSTFNIYNSRNLDISLDSK